MQILLFILIPSIISILFVLKSKKSEGSDHQIHIAIVDRIKMNNHQYIVDYILSINETYAWYPQLFHWLLSFLPEKIYKEKYQYINLVIKLIEIIAFNTFLIFLYNRLVFDTNIFIYANIIVNIFPFSYVAWNAKNMGLSPRGMGLVAGQIYTYLIVIYLITGNVYILLPLLFIVFVILLSSLIAMQYVCLSIPFFVILFSVPEIILLPFVAFGMFYMLMPLVAKNSIIGQFNHKRCYALVADMFILKSRPSIYRDFFYDFWIKFKTGLRKGIGYIYTNPIIEIIYGIPFLWLLIYWNINHKFIGDSGVIFYIILSSLGLFFLTSFKWTRFLGEPQRYLEFVIPLITILYVLNFDLIFHVGMIVFCLVMITASSFAMNRHGETKTLSGDKALFLDYMSKENKYRNQICISNDNEIVKYFTGMGINVVRPDYSVYIRNKEEYYKNYYNKSLYAMSPWALESFYNKFKVDFLVLNTDFYSLELLREAFPDGKITLVRTFGKYELYEF